MKSNLLKAKVVENELTTNELLKALKSVGVKLSYGTWYKRLAGDTEFTRNEIQGLINVLNLSSEDVQNIFFNH